MSKSFILVNFIHNLNYMTLTDINKLDYIFVH